MDQKKSGIFVREATGLVRNVSLLDVISINLGSMSLAPALATLGLTMVLVPSVGGMNLVYASLIGALLVVPMVVVYTMMSARIKRTGGDYVWVSRAFGGLFGGSLALSGWVVAAFAFVALDVIATVLAIGSVGVQLGYLNLLPLALPSSVPGSSPNEQVVIVVVIMLAFLLLNLFNSRLGFRIVSAMMIFSLITLLMAIGVLFAGGSSGATTYVSYLQSVGSLLK